MGSLLTHLHKDGLIIGSLDTSTSPLHHSTSHHTPTSRESDSVGRGRERWNETSVNKFIIFIRLSLPGRIVIAR